MDIDANKTPTQQLVDHTYRMSRKVAEMDGHLDQIRRLGGLVQIYAEREGATPDLKRSAGELSKQIMQASRTFLEMRHELSSGLLSAGLAQLDEQYGDRRNENSIQGEPVQDMDGNMSFPEGRTDVPPGMDSHMCSGCTQCKHCKASLAHAERAQRWADRLSQHIAERFGAELGEFTPDNNPWERALDILESSTLPEPDENPDRKDREAQKPEHCGPLQISDHDAETIRKRFESYEGGESSWNGFMHGVLTIVRNTANRGRNRKDQTTLFGIDAGKIFNAVNRAYKRGGHGNTEILKDELGQILQEHEND